MSLAYEAELEPEEEVETPETQANVERLIANIKSSNLAKDMDDTELARIGQKVVEEYEIDLNSRKAAKWDERNKSAMDLALQVKEAKSYPWPNAANVKYPLLTTAAIQFAARAYPAIVDGATVVRGKVQGKPNDQKQQRADRIGRHMSWQLLEEMDGWEEDTDRLLHMLPITGCVFRKTWFDPIKGHNCSELIPPDKFVVNYCAKDIETVPRGTQVCEYYPHEIEAKFRGGTWLRQELGEAQDAGNDEQAPHTFLEQHRLLDLDEDKYPEPYIVTVHKETMKVVRIVARYDEDGVYANDRGEVTCIKPVRYFTKYGFIPSPDGSFYDIGFGQLLNALNETINSTLNQLLDAGHLANTQGGFIGSGVSIKSGRLRFEPGEWKKAEVAGGALKENIVPLPVGKPSAVLFNLLGMLVEAARDITATKDILTGETQQTNQPVGTTLAMIEQGLKVFTAIYKRIHRSLRQELACLYRLNRLYLPQEQYFAFQDQPEAVSQQDYADDIDVLPVSDPTTVSDMQKLGRAQYLGQFLGKGLDDMKIVERMLEAASVPDIEELMPKGPPPTPPELLIEQKKLKQDDQRIALEDRKVKLLEANAKAGNTGKYASALASLAGIGATPEGNMGINPEALILAEDLHATATQEVENEAVRPEEFRGMEEPPPDQAVPPVPDGPAGNLGQGMDGGGEPVVGPADQGGPDGGVIDPGMG